MAIAPAKGKPMKRPIVSFLLTLAFALTAMTWPADAASRQATGFPFSDDFELSTFGANWLPLPTNNGVAEINTDNPHTGTRSVFLGQKVTGVASASLILTPDLTGQTSIFLDFWSRRTGTTAAGTRSVSISGNGGTTWVYILDLSGASLNFSHQVIDLASAAQANGIALNNQFRLRFFYTNNPTAAGNGLVIDDVRLTTRDQETVSFPYAQDSFETGLFQQGLYPQSTSEGVAEINTDNPHTGTRSVFLGQKVTGVASASLILTPDLTGQTSIFLDFWSRRTGTTALGTRSVSISGNGGTTWVYILDLSGASLNFSHQVIDLASAAQANGIALNNQFRLRFFYTNNPTAAGNGLVIDDIRIGAIDPNSNLSVYLPLVQH